MRWVLFIILAVAAACGEEPSSATASQVKAVAVRGKAFDAAALPVPGHVTVVDVWAEG